MLTIFLGSHAFAADITVADLSDPVCENIGGSKLCVTLLVEGTIETGDAEKLSRIIDRIEKELSKTARQAVRVGNVHFNSPGGDLFEAMNIGRQIREHMIGAQITFDSRCYSSCVVAFLGGVIRIPVGPLGIHSFYSIEFIGPNDFMKASAQYNIVSQQLEAYMKEMRIPLSLLDEMKKVPHNQLKTLDFEDLEHFALIGIDPVYSQIRQPPQGRTNTPP